MKKIVQPRLKAVVRYKILFLSLFFSLLLVSVSLVSAASPTNPQSGSVGLQGTIPGPAPTTGATIATPTNGQVFSNLPITVQGLCPSGLLIKLLINNIFSG